METASIGDEIAKRATRAEKDAELFAHLPRSVERRFRLRYLPVQPMSQPTVELARGLALDPFALKEELCSPLKVSGTGRGFVELADGCQQSS
jgi:hypothetical protein